MSRLSVADPGFPRSRGEPILLFSNIFAENCMKMEEIGRRGTIGSDNGSSHNSPRV